MNFQAEALCRERKTIDCRVVQHTGTPPAAVSSIADNTVCYTTLRSIPLEGWRAPTQKSPDVFPSLGVSYSAQDVVRHQCPPERTVPWRPGKYANMPTFLPLESTVLDLPRILLNPLPPNNPEPRFSSLNIQTLDFGIEHPGH